MQEQSAVRSIEGLKIRNFSLKIFVLSINLYAFHLLLDNTWLKISGIILGLFSLIFSIGFTISERRKKSVFPKKFKGSKLDIFRINRKYLQINKKYLFISILGLTLAILIISQTILLTSIFNQQAVNDYLEDADNRALHIEYSVESKDEFDEITDNLALKTIEALSENDLKLDNITKAVSIDIQYVVGPEQNDTWSRYIPTEYVRGIAWKSLDYNLLLKLPTFNLNMSPQMDEEILILPQYSQNYSDFKESKKIEILFGDPFRPIEDNSSFETLNFTVNQVWIPTQADVDYISLNNLWDEASFIYGALMMPEIKLWDTFEKTVNYYENITNDFGFNPTALVRSDVTIEYPDFAEVELIEFESLLIKLESEINSWLSNEFGNSQIQYKYFWVSSPLKDAIRSYINNSGNTDTVLFLISVPLAGLALVFIFFALRMVEERRKKIVATMKIRGTSDDQLQSILLAEIVIISIFSIVIGMILSIPWTLFSLNYSSVYTGSLNSLPIPETWYWKIPLIGFIFSLDVNIISFQRMMDASFEDVEQVRENTVPFWQKYYIDLVIFLTSIGYWVILPKLDSGAFNNLNENLGPAMLILVIFSTPLILARYFSFLTGIVFLRIFKTKGGLFKVASRNLSKHRFSTSQLAGFLLLGIMLTNVSHIVPSTYVEWGAEKNYYDLGADIYVEGIDSSNTTVWKYFENVTDIEAYTEISKFESSMGGIGILEDLQLNQINFDPQFSGAFTFLGIQPENFTDAAFWKDKYNDQSLNSLVSSISSNTSVAIQKEGLDKLGLDIGDKYTYFYGYTDQGPVGTTFDITNDFNLFPNLVTESPISDPNQGQDDFYNYDSSAIAVLAHIDLVKEIGKSSSGFGSFSVGAYVKISKGANITQAVYEIENLFKFNSSISVHSIDEIQNAFSQSPETKVIVTVLEGMQILTMLMVAISLGYYSFVNLNSRKKEIGIYRSLGMVRRQIALILTLEIMTIITVGLLFGFLAGQLVANSFFHLLTAPTSGQTIPPTTVAVPWIILGQLFLGFLIIGWIFALISAFIVTRDETGNILRED